jgi:hypothetical protein
MIKQESFLDEIQLSEYDDGKYLNKINYWIIILTVLVIYSTGVNIFYINEISSKLDDSIVLHNMTVQGLISSVSPSNDLVNTILNLTPEKDSLGLALLWIIKSQTILSKRSLSYSTSNSNGNVPINIIVDPIDSTSNVTNILFRSVSNSNSDLYEGLIKDLVITLQILSVLQNDYTKLEISNIRKELVSEFKLLGVDLQDIKQCISYYLKNSQIMDNPDQVEINLFWDGIQELIKDYSIPEKYIHKLNESVLMLHSTRFTDESSKNIVGNIKLSLIKKIKEDLSYKTTKRFVQRNSKYEMKNKSRSDFRGEIIVSINSSILEIKQKIISNFNATHEDTLNKLRHKISILNTVLTNLYNTSINVLLEKINLLNYNKSSMEMVNVHRDEILNLLLKKYKLNSAELLNEVSKLSNLHENPITVETNRLNRMNEEGGLRSRIDLILRNGNISLELKQISIEKLLLQTDLNYFEDILFKSVSVKSVVLHDIYGRLNHKLNVLIQPYVRNNFNLLLKNLNNSKGYTILTLLYIGNNNIINICFSQIMSILDKGWGEYRLERTRLLFELSTRLIKVGLSIDTNKIKDKLELDRYNFLFKMWTENDILTIIQGGKNNDEYLFNLGDTLLTLIINECDIFKLDVTKNSMDNTSVSITLNEDFKHKLVIATANVTKLPMLTKPIPPLENGTYFPYLTPEISHIYNSTDTIITKKFDTIYTTEKQNVLINTINILNNIPFEINTRVLDFILEEWENKESSLFKGLNTLLIVNDTDSKEVKIRKQSHNSQYYNYLNTINIATLYKEQKFYFPTFADFRGRIYTYSNYLSYQGNDLSRSLLLFANYKNPINKVGLEYLKIYLANLSGYSKKSWDGRLNWVENNCKIMIDLFNTDKELFYTKYLNNSKEPFQCISILYALEKVIKEKKAIIKNPILFDASCSGIQHLSALTRETDMAIKTNLIGSGDYAELPNDFYNYAKDLIQEDLDKSNKDNLVAIKMNRSLIKKSVMTIPYNISLIGIKEQILEYFSKTKFLDQNYYNLSKEYSKHGKVILLNYKELNEFSVIIFKVLTERLPSLKILTTYLNSLIKVLLKLNQPIFWITPSGLHIRLSTSELKSIRTKSRLLPNTKPITISIPSDKLNKSAIRRSFMPNLIHSLDASNIHILCNKLVFKKDTQIKNIYTIHDCFASTVNEMKILEKYVKEAFIEIYFKDGNYLEKMHNHLIDQIKSFHNPIIYKDGQEFIIINKEEVLLPTIPISFTSNAVMNTFIEGIKKSKYFIG